MFRLLVLVVGVLIMAGCASNPPAPPPGPSVEAIYSQINRQGARDAVDLLREGMRQNELYGASDPYIPLRTPEVIVPIWVPPYVDPKTGDRVDGHWEHAVIDPSTWNLGGTGNGS